MNNNSNLFLSLSLSHADTLFPSPSLSPSANTITHSGNSDELVS